MCIRDRRTASPGFPAPFLVQQTRLLQVARLLSCVLLTYMLLICMIADCTCLSSVDGEWAEMGCALGIWTQGFRGARSYLSGFPELICALTTAICAWARGLRTGPGPLVHLAPLRHAGRPTASRRSARARPPRRASSPSNTCAELLEFVRRVIGSSLELADRVNAA